MPGGDPIKKFFDKALRKPAVPFEELFEQSKAESNELWHKYELYKHQQNYIEMAKTEIQLLTTRAMRIQTWLRVQDMINRGFYTTPEDDDNEFILRNWSE